MVPGIPVREHMHSTPYVNSTPYVILSAAYNFTPFENYPCQVFTLLLDYQLYNCSKTGYEAL